MPNENDHNQSSSSSSSSKTPTEPKKDDHANNNGIDKVRGEYIIPVASNGSKGEEEEEQIKAAVTDKERVEAEVKVSPELIQMVVQKLYDSSTVKRIEGFNCNEDDVEDENNNKQKNKKNKLSSLRSFRINSDEASSLSSTPWIYHPPSSTKITSKPDAKVGIGNGNSDNKAERAATNPTKPTRNYLDLRTSQNIRWADLKLQRGTELAKEYQQLSQQYASSHLANKRNSQLLENAEKCYIEGLNMVPNHTQLLVAYGALCANDDEDDSRLEKSIQMLKKAVQIDENVPNGKKYLDIVMQKIKRKKEREEIIMDAVKEEKLLMLQQQMALTKNVALNRTEKAIQDALAERAFLSGDNNTDAVGIDHQDGAKDDKYPLLDEKYPLVEEPASTKIERAEDEKSNEKEKRRKKKSSKEKRRKREKHHHHHYRRRKSRKHRHYSDDDSDISSNSSNDDDDDSNSSNSSNYRSHKRRKKRKHNHHHHSRSSRKHKSDRSESRSRSRRRRSSRYSTDESSRGSK